MSRSSKYNGGAYVRSVRALGHTTAVAAGSGDATQANGSWVDRKSGALGIATSAKLIVSYTTTLAAAATLSFAVQFQDAIDAAGTGAANYEAAIPAAVKSTGAAGGSTNADTAEYDVDLGGARQFIRAQITPDLSAGSADTAAISAILLFFGDHRGPSTKSTTNTGSADAI